MFYLKMKQCVDQLREKCICNDSDHLKYWIFWWGCFSSFRLLNICHFYFWELLIFYRFRTFNRAKYHLVTQDFDLLIQGSCSPTAYPYLLSNGRKKTWNKRLGASERIIMSSDHFWSTTSDRLWSKIIDNLQITQTFSLKRTIIYKNEHHAVLQKTWN